MKKSNVISILNTELNQIVKQKGLTIAQLAEISDVGVGTVHKILQKDPKVNVTLQILEKIANALELPIESLLTNNKSSISKSKAPLIEWHEILNRNSIDITEKKQVSVHAQLSPNAFSVKMVGNSMEPIFPDKTILVIDPNTPIYDGCFAIISFDDSPIFKQIIIDPPTIYCKSLINSVNNMTQISENMVIGTLVESIRLHEN